MDEKKIEKAKKKLEKLHGNDQIKKILGKTSNQALLAYVAAHKQDAGLSHLAFERLKSRDALEFVVRKGLCSPVRHLAFRAIGYSRDELLEIYRTAGDFELQLLALRGIDDRDVLFEVLLKEEDEDFYKDVLDGIDDQSMLVELMAEDPNGAHRNVIIGKITDRDCLARAAVKDDSPEVRRKAIRKIDDHSILARVAREDGDVDNRYIAVERLEDQDVLLEIAENDEASYVRLEAARRISDPKALAKLLKTTFDEEIRRIALKGTGQEREIQRDLMKKLRDCLEGDDAPGAMSLLREIGDEIADPAVMDEGIDVILKCLRGDWELKSLAADAMITIAGERPEVLNKHWNAIAELVNEPEKPLSHSDYHTDTTETWKSSCAVDEHTDTYKRPGLGKNFPPYPGKG